jgi:hypothetical protein
MPRLPFLGATLLALALGCAGGDTPSAGPPAAAPAPNAPTAAPAAPAAAPAPSASASARPLYYDRALTPADLEGRTLRELALMRNTIFARAGNPFVKPWLDAYFRAQPWYSPKTEMDLSALAAYDHQNVALIVKAEQSFSRDDLLARRAAIQARPATPEDDIELTLIGRALGEWSGSADVPTEARDPLADPTVLDRQLSLAQVEKLSRRDLRLLRNTIYARHGREFKSATLAYYFHNMSWYAVNPAFSEAMLTEVDKRNIQLVQSMEDRLGGPMREWEAQRQEGWFEGA